MFCVCKRNVSLRCFFNVVRKYSKQIPEALVGYAYVEQAVMGVYADRWVLGLALG